MTSETELKKKELERLLKENKIELSQYLEISAKLEAPLSLDKKSQSKSKKEKYTDLMKMDLLLFISPFLILIGWIIAGLNPVQGYESMLSMYETVGYPYSPVGLGITMIAAILLSTGLACHWVKSVSRAGLMVSQVMGWFFIVFTLYVLATVFSEVWVQDTPYSWHNLASINPFICGISVLLWFIGTLTIAYGLAPSRKWLNKNFS